MIALIIVFCGLVIEFASFGFVLYNMASKVGAWDFASLVKGHLAGMGGMALGAFVTIVGVGIGIYQLATAYVA